MPATTTSLDTAVSNLQASADTCEYGLTERKLKPLAAAMEQHALCLTALPAIMAMPSTALGNDSKQKYIKVTGAKGS